MKHMNWKTKVVNCPTEAHGFSLLELLIVLLIIGVLAAIAIPSLTGARRAVGEQTVKARLLDLAARQEAFRTSLGKRRYAASWDDLKAPLPNNKLLVTDSDLQIKGWTLTASELTAATFKFLAAPAAGGGFSYCIFEDGVLRRADGECQRDSAIVED